MLFTFTVGEPHGKYRRLRSFPPSGFRWAAARGLSLAQRSMASGLSPGLDPDRDRRFHRLVAAWSGRARLHLLEQEHGMWTPSRTFRRQDGAYAVEDGADARPHGRPRLLGRVQRQPRVRRLPDGDAAPP